MRIKGFFSDRLPPDTVLTGVQQMEVFLELIRKKNALVVTGRQKEGDDLQRGQEATSRRRNSTSPI
jgi:hypothetical protein